MNADDCMALLALSWFVGMLFWISTWHDQL